MAITTGGNHPVAVAQFAVALRTENIESLLAAIHDPRGDREGKAVPILSIDLSRGQKAGEGQLSASHGSRDSRPRRHPVRKEVARLERIVFGLVSHLLTATECEHREDHEASGERRAASRKQR